MSNDDFEGGVSNDKCLRNQIPGPEKFIGRKAKMAIRSAVCENSNIKAPVKEEDCPSCMMRSASTIHVNTEKRKRKDSMWPPRSGKRKETPLGLSRKNVKSCCYPYTKKRKR